MKRPYSHISFTLKGLYILCFAFLLVSCSSTKLISSWKNPDYNTFKPKKILVVGVTPDYEARKAFEFQVISGLNARKINALQSAVVFASSFRDSEQSEKDIEAEVDKLISSGYDTVLVSLVKGIGENASYASESSKTDYHIRKFVGYYLIYQEAYFNQNNYAKYKVFNIETSIYSIKKDSSQPLVWRATFDLIDPGNPTKAIDIYSKKLIKVLEKEKIIPKKSKAIFI